MVSPIYIIGTALAGAFLLALVDRAGRRLSLAFTAIVLAVMTAIPALWLGHFAAGGSAIEVYTAGFAPPVSINLRMGVAEAVIAALVNLSFLVGMLYVGPRFRERGAGSMVLYLMMAMGATGLILTRDLFNMFVFLEILSVATYAMISLDRSAASLQAGFKYIIAGGISSALILLGILYVYRQSGNLNIDVIASAPALLRGPAGVASLFLLTMALVIELKPFPANGWALDVYQASEPGVAAVISVGNSAAIIFSLYKIIPLLPAFLLPVLTGIGMVTFFFSNLVGLKQDDTRRMLGYSSIAQMGLVLASMTYLVHAGQSATLIAFVTGGIFVTHFFAKAGLYWLTGILQNRSRHASLGILQGRPVITLIWGVLLVSLAGLPPFPAFFAKWQLVGQFAEGGSYLWLVAMLVGSLFEAGYLFRWFASARSTQFEAVQPRVTQSLAAEAAGVADGSGNTGAEVEAAATRAAELLQRGAESSGKSGGGAWAVGIFAFLTSAAALLWSTAAGISTLVSLAPLAAGLFILLLEWLPSRMKTVLVLAVIALFGYWILPQLSGIGLILGALLTAGSGIIIFAGFSSRGGRTGWNALAAVLALSLGGLVVAPGTLGFFFTWELMTVSSYLLLLRAPRNVAPAGRYLMFSLSAAYLIMVGLILAAPAGASGAGIAFPGASLVSGQLNLTLGTPTSVFATLGALWSGLGGAASVTAATTLVAFALLMLGFLVKAGAVGAHVWLPGTYARAEDDTSAIFSAVISKASVFGLILFAAVFGMHLGGYTQVSYLIGWIGVLTALFGALLAVFQEDAKYLLAYSSMSQIGYIIMAVGLATHLGWTAGVYIAVIHFLFKGMLFLSIAGVIMRAGTSNMYELGGLIKKMPVSYLSTLMAIIALSGVPPLAGFGAKWMIYSALIEKGWYLQAGIAFFASTVAFLYLFRLIYTVFLGQLKDPLREVKEAPIALLIPQVILMISLFAVSMFPNLILHPIMNGVSSYFSSTVTWNNYTVISALGYWNGNMVMWVTIAVFILPLAWLMIVMRRPQRVGQFNMVFAGERPDRPETTHFAHNFFAPYRRALGFLTTPGTIRFWNGFSEGVHSVSAMIRRIYSGNGQTYALHILLFVAVVYLILGGVQ